MTEDEQGAPSQAVHQVSGNTCASHIHTPNHDAAQNWGAQAGASEHLAHDDTERYKAGNLGLQACPCCRMLSRLLVCSYALGMRCLNFRPRCRLTVHYSRLHICMSILQARVRNPATLYQPRQSNQQAGSSTLTQWAKNSFKSLLLGDTTFVIKDQSL